MLINTDEEVVINKEAYKRLKKTLRKLNTVIYDSKKPYSCICLYGEEQMTIFNENETVRILTNEIYDLRNKVDSLEMQLLKSKRFKLF